MGPGGYTLSKFKQVKQHYHETHVFAHTGVDELEEAKIEAELIYEHYKAPTCKPTRLC